MEGTWVPEPVVERRATVLREHPLLDFTSAVSNLHPGAVSAAVASISLTVTPQGSTCPSARVLVLWTLGTGVAPAVPVRELWSCELSSEISDRQVKAVS